MKYFQVPLLGQSLLCWSSVTAPMVMHLLKKALRKFNLGFIALLLVVANLTACGGASPIDSEGIPQPQLSSPSIEVDVETDPTITVEQISVNGSSVDPTSVILAEGDQVSIRVSAIDQDNETNTAEGIVNFAWIQYEGVTTQLSGSNSAQVEFEAPIIPDDSTTEPISMQVTVQDDEGSVSQQTISFVMANNANLITPQFTDPILASCVELEALEQGLVSAQYLTELDCSSFADRFCINSAANCLINVLTDIEQLTLLERVDLSNNNITNVQPLANLTLLNHAGLSNNPIESLAGLDLQRVNVEVSPVITGLPEVRMATEFTIVELDYRLIDPVGAGEFIVGEWTSSDPDLLFNSGVEANEFPQKFRFVAPAEPSDQNLTMTLTVSKYGFSTQKTVKIIYQ